MCSVCIVTISVTDISQNQGFMTLYRASLEKEVDPVIKEWAATFASSKGCLVSYCTLYSVNHLIASPVHSILYVLVNSI